MLDFHTVSGTPGATTTITKLATLPASDLATVLGVPTDDNARLIMWGSVSLVANTIYLTQLLSQDQVDSINGEVINLGTSGLQNEVHKFTNLPYVKGPRRIGQSTNTAQTATSLGFTLDHYAGGSAIHAKGLRFAPGQIAVRQTLNTNVAVVWTSTGLAPAEPLPNGKYALLGAYVALITMPTLIRFQHNNFLGKLPGFPTIGTMLVGTAGIEQGTKDALMQDAGYQFVTLSELTGQPCVPVFSVSNAGTGLNIQAAAAANTDTPQVTLNLVKIG